jgi:hypothetical protein
MVFAVQLLQHAPRLPLLLPVLLPLQAQLQGPTWFLSHKAHPLNPFVQGLKVKGWVHLGFRYLHTTSEHSIKHTGSIQHKLTIVWLGKADTGPAAAAVAAAAASAATSPHNQLQWQPSQPSQ